MHGLQDMPISAHPEVIVGAPDRDSLLLCRHMSTRKFFGKAIDVVEVPVRLVLVLLVEFVVVEMFVVKTWGSWRIRFGARERI